MKKIVSFIFSLVIEGTLKNRIRCLIYNTRKQSFKIHFSRKIFRVRYSEFQLLFEENPYHLLIEQEQYNRYYELKQGNTVIDAGGFWGTYSLFASKMVGSSGQVIVFEPDKENLKKLTGHIDLNQLTNIRIINKGLWKHTATLKFSNTGGLGSSFIDAQSCNTMAEVVSLDNFLNKEGIKKVDFIKMDIEGAELEAIDGAEKTLGSGTHLAIASYHIVNDEPTSIKLEVLLGKHNYDYKTEFEPERVTFAWPAFER